jgi:hypothetical protein
MMSGQMNNTNTIERLIDTQQLHELCMDYRAASIPNAQACYEAILNHIAGLLQENKKAAYESCLSEFEQVAVFGEAEEINRTDAGKTAEMQAHSIGIPLFTRKG